MRFKSEKWERDNYKNENFEIIGIVLEKEKKDIRKGVKRYSLENQDISYKNAEILVNLYQNIDSSNIAKKESLLECMFTTLRNKLSDSYENDRYVGSTGVLYFGLCKIGYSYDATLSMVVNIENNIATVIPILLEILKSNINYFSSKELGYIQKKISDINYYEDGDLGIKKEELNELITDLRFENLEGKLQGIVIEINNDKKQVQKYLKDFGFDKHYNITLSEIDKFLDASSEITLASAIGSFREFFKNFYIDLAKKIANLNGYEEIPKNSESTTDVGHARKYIEKEFGLSSDESKLLNAYKDITNNSGSHSILKEKRYLRLARNIGIEISLFMLSKFENYKKVEQ